VEDEAETDGRNAEPIFARKLAQKRRAKIFLLFTPDDEN
jgi:hypothetical protein